MNPRFQKTVGYEFHRGDTVYFVFADRIQCSTITYIIATIESPEKAANDAPGVVYVVDESKIVNPEAGKRYARAPKFSNYISIDRLFETPEAAAMSLLNPPSAQEEFPHQKPE